MNFTERKIAVVVTMLVVLSAFGLAKIFEIDFSKVETALKNSGGWAPILFLCLMVIGIVISPIPTSPLTLMSPKLFGPWEGWLISLGSATAGASVAFLIARKLGRRFFIRFPQYQKFERLLPPDATAFAVFLLRLPPSPTFDLVSYLAGLMPMPTWQFMLATFLGMIPVTTALCLAGTVLPSVWIVPLLVGIAFFWIIRLLRSKFSKSKGARPTEVSANSKKTKLIDEPF